MTSWPPSWKYDAVAEIQSMHIYLQNILDKFRPDPIWKDGALVFLKRLPQRKEEQQQEQDE